MSFKTYDNFEWDSYEDYNRCTDGTYLWFKYIKNINKYIKHNMKKNNLPDNWLVLNDGSQLFKDTVIVYINKHKNSCGLYIGDVTNYYYGIMENELQIAVILNTNANRLSLQKFIELTPSPKHKPEPTLAINKSFKLTEIKKLLEKEYDKEDVTDIINLLNK